MKNIETIPIARQKIARRNITEAWINETLTSPHEIIEGYGGRKVAQRIYVINDKEYLLRVILKKTKISILL